MILSLQVTRLRSLLVILLLAPAPARADDGEPAIALLDVRSAPGTQPVTGAKVRVALAEALGKYRVRYVRDHPAVANAYGAGVEATTAAGLAQARQRAREGKKLFDELDAKAAEVKFRQAADLFEANVGGLSTPGDLIGTYLFLAQVFFATEREVLARDIFKRVVQLQPDLVLDKAKFPTNMIATFEDVKKTLLASPLGSLKVESSPSPAVVYLDGRERGKTPLDLVNIPAGVHTLSVRRPGYAPLVRPVDVVSFRVDRIDAQLQLERHPMLDIALTPKGPETKDALGTTVTDYVAAVAKAARLDIVFVGRVTKSQLEVRAYRASSGTWSDVQSFDLGRSLEPVAGALLQRAASDGWIPAIAARRSVEAGGGALDETATFLVRAALTPGARLAGTSTNFPDTPGVGLRIAADYRLGSRLLLSAETGFDGVIENGVMLVDSSGSAAGGGNIQQVWTSIPLDLGARYYFGVSTFAPYACGGLGLRYDSLAFRESLPFDSVKGSSGIGFDGFLGGGVDWALSPRSGLFFEGRLHAGTVGVGDAKLHTSADPPAPDRTVPVDAGLYTGLRVYLGYLQVF